MNLAFTLGLDLAGTALGLTITDNIRSKDKKILTDDGRTLVKFMGFAGVALIALGLLTMTPSKSA